jgi:hypothetical protein
MYEVMSMARLTCLDFNLEINFDKKIDSTTNQTVVNENGERVYDVHISVSDVHYSGDITIAYFAESEIKSRVQEICSLFQTLKEGKSGFYDWDADINFVEFVSDGFGHFTIRGTFTKLIGVDNNNWSLKFSTQIDQTYLKPFIHHLQQEI